MLASFSIVFCFLEAQKSSSKIRFDCLRYFMNIHTKRLFCCELTHGVMSEVSENISTDEFIYA